MLKRGFKAQSERRSAEFRKQLGLEVYEPLSAFALAKHLNVRCSKASDVKGVDKQDIRQLVEIDSKSWSAFTLSNGGTSVVIYNCSQSPPRVNSVLMHELSHIILGHELYEPSYLENDVFLHGNFSEENEAEADWLGAALLLPRPALVAILESGIVPEVARNTYNVSKQMYDYRMRITGVPFQMANRKNRRR